MPNTVKVDFKKLDENAIVPVYSTEFAAGADIYSIEEVLIESFETKFIHTGISVSIPESLVGLVYARSGLSCKNGLAPANKVGVIDSDYRGEIMVALYNHSKVPFKIEKGDRIAQIVFMPYFKAEFNEVENLDETVRGVGGFGSTGLN